MSSDSSKPSLVVYNAHNGISLNIPKPVPFSSLKDFKEYLLKYYLGDSGIDLSDLFLLTSFGMKVNFNIIDELKEIYIFDKRLFAESGTAILNDYLKSSNEIHKIEDPLLNPHNGDGISRRIDKEINLRSTELWSKECLEKIERAERTIQEYIGMINAIFMCLSIMFQFGINFFNSIKKGLISFQNQINTLIRRTVHKTWKSAYEQLYKLPPFVLLNYPQKPLKLVDFLNVEDLERSDNFIGNNLPNLESKSQEIEKFIIETNRCMEDLDETIRSLRDESISRFRGKQSHSAKLEEISRIRQKIQHDIKMIKNEHNADSISMYSDHAKGVGEMFQKAQHIEDFLTTVKNFHHHLSVSSAQVFQKVASIQMKMVQFRDDIRASGMSKGIQSSADLSSLLNNINYQQQHLSLAIDIPTIFGFVMIEKRRQYEWYDFYSKGVVKNVSEQLVHLISREGLSRSIWLKKFGDVLSKLNKVDKSSLRSNLPSIDIALTNGSFKDDQGAFKILKDATIERKDINNYIKFVQANHSLIMNSENASNQLNENYQDLIKSTNILKNVTKAVSFLSTSDASELPESKIILEANNSKGLKEFPGRLNKGGISSSFESHYDDQLVSSLKARIRKLENLLYQQQFKDQATWPTENSKANFLNKVENFGFRKLIGSTTEQSDVSTAITPKKVAQEIKSLKEDGNSIKSEMGVENDYISEIRKLKEKITEINEENIRGKAIIDSKSSELTSLSKDIDSKDLQIHKLKEQVEKLSKENSEIKEELQVSVSHCSSLETELEDSKSMCNNLLSNLALKENETASERNALEQQIQSLKLANDEAHEDYENLMELTSNEMKRMDNMLSKFTKSNFLLLASFRNVVILVYQYVVEFFLTLEAMGLLLEVDKENGNLSKYKISRVKGLKSKKDSSGMSAYNPNTRPDGQFVESYLTTVPVTSAMEELNSRMEWVNDLNIFLAENILFDDSDDPPSSANTNKTELSSGQGNDILFSSISSKSANFMQKYLRVIEMTLNKVDGSSKFEKFLNFIVSMNKDEDPNLSETNIISKTPCFFLPSITKRFNDVEGFAKKLSKESKSRALDLEATTIKLSEKITINNFQIGDLVLFLPTKAEDNETILQPWAAFNIGAPHYFLRLNLPGKEPTLQFNHLLDKRDWLVGKIKCITEYRVTKENYSSDKENMFKLSEGITWYIIDAEEKIF